MRALRAKASADNTRARNSVSPRSRPRVSDVVTYSLPGLSAEALRLALATQVSRERSATAVLLAHIAEFDARRLYLPAPYPSMHSYCVHVLHLSEDAADKRIHAARAARKHPAIFGAVADGRL